MTPDELAAVAALAADGPIHIHVAEQVKEVEDCLAWSGARPVEWLLANADVDARWCLIHATHMTDAETDAHGRERRGRRPLPDHRGQSRRRHLPGAAVLDAGGRFGIGSDSNVLIGVADELRQLEYSQRLAHRARNVLGRGRRLDRPRAVRRRARRRRAGARRRAGRHRGRRMPADFVSLDAGHPSLAGKRGDAILDAWIFANGGKRRLRLGARTQAGRGRPASSCARRSRRRFRTVMTELAAWQLMDSGRRRPGASLHQRILADISERILSGDWPPGHRIPFEHELSAEYGCSRMTVNKALSQLAKSRADRAAPALRQLRRAGRARRPRCSKSTTSGPRCRRSACPIATS